MGSKNRSLMSWSRRTTTQCHAIWRGCVSHLWVNSFSSVLPRSRWCATDMHATTKGQMKSHLAPLKITDACIQRIIKHKENPQKADEALWITLVEGACKGFKVQIKFLPQPPCESDIIFERKGATVIVPGAHYPKFAGSTLDWTVSMGRNAFALVENPLAVSYCGCKESFTPADFPQF